MNEILNTTPIKTYNNIDSDRCIIYRDNRNKAGVYRWVNKTNNKSYVGSSIDLSLRFRAYLSIKNMNRILKTEKSLIYSAIVKHGYSCFTLEILEYCDRDMVLEREQYYINNINPTYNILKIARSRLGYTPNIRTRLLMSIAARKNALVYKEEYKINTTRTIKTSREVTIKTRNILSLRSQGVTVKILDKSGNLIGKFNTIKHAAKYLNVTVPTIKSILDRGFSYDDYIYEFEPKDNRIWIYNENYMLINVLKNAKTVSNIYNIPRSTLSSYINSDKIYKNKFYFHNSEYKK